MKEEIMDTATSSIVNGLGALIDGIKSNRILKEIIKGDEFKERMVYKDLNGTDSVKERYGNNFSGMLSDIDMLGKKFGMSAEEIQQGMKSQGVSEFLADLAVKDYFTSSGFSLEAVPSLSLVKENLYDDIMDIDFEEYQDRFYDVEKEWLDSLEAGIKRKAGEEISKAGGKIDFKEITGDVMDELGISEKSFSVMEQEFEALIESFPESPVTKSEAKKVIGGPAKAR